MEALFKLLKFDEKGLMPAVIQDRRTKKVLTLCYMNAEALERTLTEGVVYVYRRSKALLMKKGQTSGCIQKVKGIYIDCEGNSLLITVDQVKAACHEGYFTCYFRQLDKEGAVTIKGKRIFDPKEVYNKSS
jgi:phosphoribosyl-AMP cyclohydrolase